MNFIKKHPYLVMFLLGILFLILFVFFVMTKIVPDAVIVIFLSLGLLLVVLSICIKFDIII